MNFSHSTTREADGCVSPVNAGASASLYRVERASKADKLRAFQTITDVCAANRCVDDFEFYCYHPASNARVAKQGDRLARRRACRAHAEAFAKAHGIEMPR